MVALVGAAGAVGQNLIASGGIDRSYDSAHVGEAYGLKPELLIYAGLWENEKTEAETDPSADIGRIVEAEQEIWQIESEKLVLISTVDVFREPKGVDENTEIDTDDMRAYGHVRYLMEKWVRQFRPDALIVRLPAIYGDPPGRNFISDMIRMVPELVEAETFRRLAKKAPELRQYYQLRDDRVWQCGKLTGEERMTLGQTFRKLGYTAIHNTDSRSCFQFYPLTRLWGDIRLAMQHDIRLWHAVTQPVSAAEICQAVDGEEFDNELAGTPADYDVRTVHDALFSGSHGYLWEKQKVLEELARLIEDQRKRP